MGRLLKCPCLNFSLNVYSRKGKRGPSNAATAAPAAGVRLLGGRPLNTDSLPSEAIDLVSFIEDELHLEPLALGIGGISTLHDFFREERVVLNLFQVVRCINCSTDVYAMRMGQYEQVYVSSKLVEGKDAHDKLRASRQYSSTFHVILKVPDDTTMPHIETVTEANLGDANTEDLIKKQLKDHLLRERSKMEKIVAEFARKQQAKLHEFQVKVYQESRLLRYQLLLKADRDQEQAAAAKLEEQSSKASNHAVLAQQASLKRRLELEEAKGLFPSFNAPLEAPAPPPSSLSTLPNQSSPRSGSISPRSMASVGSAVSGPSAKAPSRPQGLVLAGIPVAAAGPPRPTISIGGLAPSIVIAGANTTTQSIGSATNNDSETSESAVMVESGVQTDEPTPPSSSSPSMLSVGIQTELPPTSPALSATLSVPGLATPTTMTPRSSTYTLTPRGSIASTRSITSSELAAGAAAGPGDGGAAADAYASMRSRKSLTQNPKERLKEQALPSLSTGAAAAAAAAAGGMLSVADVLTPGRAERAKDAPVAQPKPQQAHSNGPDTSAVTTPAVQPKAPIPLASGAARALFVDADVGSSGTRSSVVLSDGGGGSNAPSRITTPGDTVPQFDFDPTTPLGKPNPGRQRNVVGALATPVSPLPSRTLSPPSPASSSQPTTSTNGDHSPAKVEKTREDSSDPAGPSQTQTQAAAPTTVAEPTAEPASAARNGSQDNGHSRPAVTTPSPEPTVGSVAPSFPENTHSMFDTVYGGAFSPPSTTENSPDAPDGPMVPTEVPRRKSRLDSIKGESRDATGGRPSSLPMAIPAAFSNWGATRGLEGENGGENGAAAGAAAENGGGDEAPGFRPPHKLLEPGKDDFVVGTPSDIKKKVGPRRSVV